MIHPCERVRTCANVCETVCETVNDFRVPNRDQVQPFRGHSSRSVVLDVDGVVVGPKDQNGRVASAKGPHGEGR